MTPEELKQTYPDHDRLLRAIEEAGHALMAFGQGVEVGLVTIDPANLPPGKGGVCQTDSDVDFSTKARIAYAGLAARDMYGMSTLTGIQSDEIQSIVQEVEVELASQGYTPSQAQEEALSVADRILDEVKHRLNHPRTRRGLERCINHLYHNLTISRLEAMELIQEFLDEE